MVYIPTEPLAHIARKSQAMTIEVAKRFAAQDGAEARPQEWAQFLVAIRAAELAVLLTSADGDQQEVADTINYWLDATSARFRLIPLA